MGSEDRALVDAARGGDARALEQLFGLHRGRVLSLLRSLLGNTHDAEDACQEALMAASHSIAQLHDPDRFGAWLAAIALHKGRDVQRRQVRESQAVTQLPPPALRLSHEDRSDANLTVYGVVRSLPEDQRLAVNLRYHSGLRYAEIAELLGVPSSTVRGLLYRATRTLREALKASFEPEGR